MNALDRQHLHSALATAVPDPDARSVHLARSSDCVDGARAREIEEAASRVARRGAQGLAAELAGHAVRLTPTDETESCVRRALAQMTHCAASGDLSGAIAIADEQLLRLPPGRLRAQMITGRVVLDFTDAEAFLLAALTDVPPLRQGRDEDDRATVRARLLCLLAWLLAIHFGRPEEALKWGQEALTIGRAHEDKVLTAQAASVVSTASLLLGQRQDSLIVEAESLSLPVVHSQLALWPQVIRGRQHLWDGHLEQARDKLTDMDRSAQRNGSEFHRPYRLCDLAQVSLAAGDLDLANQQVEEGLESARDGADARAISWLAYPAGVISAIRGDAESAHALAQRLDERAMEAHEQPRRAMADHVRALVAVSSQDWTLAREHLDKALSCLNRMGYRHPGAIPVLPLAIHVATLRGTRDDVDALIASLDAQAQGLGSPWADAHLLAAVGQRQLLEGHPTAFDLLTRAKHTLSHFGYALDASRVGYFALLAGLRAGSRSRIHDLAKETQASFLQQHAVGWFELATDALDRVSGTSERGLTTTEGHVVDLICAGQRNKQIAATLFISESTVEAHLTRIYRKAGVRNRTELAAYHRAQTHSGM